jgi:arsenite methyltransferase
MVAKARDNARRVAAANVEFRLGEIEHLPRCGRVDRCHPLELRDQPLARQARRLQTAFRVLKPGGRVAISDVVATREMPAELVENVQALTGCVAGAAQIDGIGGLLLEAGFERVKVEARSESRSIMGRCMPGAEDYVVSAIIEGTKPGGKACCAPSCCA